MEGKAMKRSWIEKLFTVNVNVTGTIHIHVDGATTCDVSAALQRIEGKADRIMSLAEDLKAGIGQLNTATNEVAARIDKLVGALGSNTLTDTEKTDILAALTAESDRLKALAADPATPVPPVPPELAAMRKK